MYVDLVCFTGCRTFAHRTFAPPYFWTVATPYFGTAAPPYFGTVAPPYFGTFAPPIHKKGKYIDDLSNYPPNVL